MSSDTPLVVVLAGSPVNGGNSDTMLEQFIEGMKETESVRIERYRAHKMLVHMHEPQFRGPLPDETEFKQFTDHLQTAHGLVIATPTYNFNIPAKLKNIIDRIGFVGLDYQKINKVKQPTGKLGYLKFFRIVSGGTPKWARALLWPIFPGFWLWTIFSYYGARHAGSIYGGGYSRQHPASDDHQTLQRCRIAGKAYAASIAAEYGSNKN